MNKIYIISFFILFVIGTSSSQTPYFKEYSLGELYKDVKVSNVFERNNGYIWFGTTKGIFRYDGIDNFVQFTDIKRFC